MNWQELQHQDELERQQACIEALKRIEAAGAPQDAIDLIAYEAGVGQLYKDKRK